MIVKEALYKYTQRSTKCSKFCSIYLRPPLLIHNLLPVSLGCYDYQDGDECRINTTEKGGIIQGTNLDIQEDGSYHFYLTAS